MLDSLVFPPAFCIHLDAMTLSDHGLLITGTTMSHDAPCPLCQHPSTQIHSQYGRRIADLPCLAQRVQIALTVRKFYCRNGACIRAIFTERLPDFLPPYARQTLRLRTTHTHLGLEVGAESGARIAARHHMPTSPDTLLRLMRQAPLPTAPTPRVLGVDDWAIRKGQTYGTILVDLERRQPVDLLPDRLADTLVQWLQDHPGVEVISRDRAEAFADGATRGAPQAIQVADRFHLLLNLRETLQRLFDRHQASLQAASAEPCESPCDPPPAVPSSVLSAITPSVAPDAPGRSSAEQQRDERRTRRVARFEEVRQLHAQGTSVRAIARELQLGRRTVQRFLVADQFPERAYRRKQPSILDPFVPYLTQQIAAGYDNGSQLWRDLHSQGYLGSRALVARWVVQHRHLGPPPEDRPVQPPRRGRVPGRTPVAPRPSQHRRSARQAAWLCMRRPPELRPTEQAFLERLCAICPEAATAYQLGQTFLQLVRDRQPAGFAAWMRDMEASGIPELCRFATGLHRDRAAVLAALTLSYSNGQTEGQITRLKLIKRSGYGRAKFDLLRQRVLAA